MATGRIVSASFLTELDKQVLELCSTIAETIQNTIKDKDLQKDFKKQFGKISYTRDGGLGLGDGKLQRDAICVRHLKAFYSVEATKYASEPIEEGNAEGSEGNKQNFFRFFGKDFLKRK